MIAILSPAKSFALVETVPMPTTRPAFAEQAARLAAAAARLRPKRLEDLMHISPDLARLNADRYASFDDQPERAAIASFDGDVYRGFDAPSADADTLAFANHHVRMLSGLYGLLRPSDAIRPYRLEMGTAWAPRVRDLYAFWKGSLARHLEAELNREGSGTILNLASKEYWQALGPHLDKDIRIVTVDFRDAGPRGLRFNTFVAKRARGAMARYLCDTRAATPDALRGFDVGGHAYDPDGSDESLMRFVRT